MSLHTILRGSISLRRKPQALAPVTYPLTSATLAVTVLKHTRPPAPWTSTQEVPSARKALTPRHLHDGLLQPLQIFAQVSLRSGATYLREHLNTPGLTLSTLFYTFPSKALITFR